MGTSINKVHDNWVLKVPFRKPKGCLQKVFPFQYFTFTGIYFIVMNENR